MCVCVSLSLSLCVCVCGVCMYVCICVCMSLYLSILCWTNFHYFSLFSLNFTNIRGGQALRTAANVYDVNDYYDLGKELGVGRFATVRLGIDMIALITLIALITHEYLYSFL